MIRRVETFRTGTVFLTLLALAGCATAPSDAGNERLDANTGTTVTVMPKPVELIIDKSRGTKTDPFAYVAPFETNRMGSHELYLWVSAPQVAGPLEVPKVYCGESAVSLERFEGSLKDVGLSSSPYKMPAPWSKEWYFKLPGEVLDCLASAARIRVVTQVSGAEPDNYVADGPATSGIGTFLSKVRT